MVDPLRRALRLAAPTLAILVGCGDVFEPRDRELVPCWPSCGVTIPDSGVEEDSGIVNDATPEDATGRDDSGADAGPREDSGADAGEPDPLVDLTPAQGTPNSITWRWNPASVPEATHGFVVRYSTNAQMVEAGGGLTWDADDDANLGFRVSPHGPGAVRQTTITELAPNSRYYARLYLHLEGGVLRPFAMGSGETRTEGGDPVRIFVDNLSAEVQREGFGEPSLAPRTHAGEGALWFEVAAHMSPSLTMLGIPAPAVVTLGDAYLELYVDLQYESGPLPVPFLRARLGGATRTFTHVYSALPGRQGWHRVQIPLSELFDPTEQRLSAEGFGEQITHFGVEAIWPPGTTVLIDDVSIFF